MSLVTHIFDGRLAFVTLNRPGALNALNGALLDDLDAALDAVESDAESRVLIMSGSERAFSVGGDLKEDHADADVRVQRMHRLALRLQRYPKISIAAIEGWALGGGLEIAMACTFRVAAPGARLGVPEIAMGLIPGFGGTQLLPRLVGSAKACEMLCDGEPVDAAEALRIGLIDRVADAPGGAVECARRLASRFTRHAAAAQLAARIAVIDGSGLPLEQALAIERRELGRLRGDAKVPEGIMAFREGQKNVRSI